MATNVDHSALDLRFVLAMTGRYTNSALLRGRYSVTGLRRKLKHVDREVLQDVIEADTHSD